MITKSDPSALRLATLILGVLLLTHGLAWLLPDVLQPLSRQTTDRMFQLRSRLEATRPAYDDTIVHVDITDQDLRDRPGYDLTRHEHARLVRNLGRLGVAAQLHDVIFAAPLNEEADADLEGATAEAGNVYYGMALGLRENAAPADTGALDPAQGLMLARNRWELKPDGDPHRVYVATRFQTTFPRLANAARGLGYLDVVVDPDGIYRRVPLLARDDRGYQPAMSLRVIAGYLDVAAERIEVNLGESIVLRGAHLPDSEQRRDVSIPIDDHGRMVVNYIGPWERMRHYRFQDIYDASDDRFLMMDLREELAGKIVVVSWVATGSGDLGPVPTDPVFPLPGVHAAVMHDILTGNFLHEVGGWKALLWIDLPLFLLLLGAARLPTIPFVSIAGVGLVGLIAAGVAAFLWGNRIVDLPRPLLFVVVSVVIVSAYRFHVESRARAVLRGTFDSYFPPSVVEKLLGQSDRLLAAARKEELTVLFSDIKSFTRLTSRMEPHDVRRLLNEYFEHMIEIVFRHQGTLDKFIGDGLMVFFGDPEPQADHALRCVEAAIEMQRTARRLSREWQARGDMPLEIRVGINTGEMIVGNMGSTRRLSYTVLGSAVNLAQRLESNAPVGGILVSVRTHELLEGAVATRAVKPLQVKGIDEPLPAYEVVQDLS